ncbi:DUF167 domain-containing protein [Candidatus Dependentiae bacterium]|nr:MAG: DUF167 domain-containing protein [Candidatus Dependentiae bacterium]
MHNISIAMLFLDIVVVPSSGKQVIIVDKQQRIKVFLKSPPEKGKANQELIRFLSEKIPIPQNQLTIVKGLTTRKKRVAVAVDISLALFLQKLGLDKQINLL